jgi:tetratricopeptide (TPR) repeat protein
LAAALSRHESNGLLHYWHGYTAQVRGHYRQAVESYRRALEFTQFQAAARGGLLVSLLRLGAKESPEEANQLAARLLAAHPSDPALLLAYAETAVLLDNVYGRSGMEGALHSLERVLREAPAPPRSPALGPYFLARGWWATGRPDLAWQEVRRAVQADRTHPPSLLLAAQLALAAEDWPACRQHAQALAELETEDRGQRTEDRGQRTEDRGQRTEDRGQRTEDRKGEPDVLFSAPSGTAVAARLLLAAALEGLGEVNAAQQTYQELIDRHPDQGAGYLRLAGLLEKARDYAGALRRLAPWRERAPGDLDAFQAHVRLLARMGQTQEAAQLAEAYLVHQLQQARSQRARAARPRTTDNGQGTTGNAGDARTDLEVSILLNVAGGFLGAGALDTAEAWAQRALRVAQGWPEAGRPAAVLAAQLALGNLYAVRSEREAGPDRAAFARKAIAAYQAVYDQDPRHAVAANNLAWLQNRTGGAAEKDAALMIVDTLRKGRYSGRPVSGDRLPLELLDTLGVIYRDCRRFQEAVALFEEAIQRYANEPRVALHLGKSYAGLNQLDKAKAQLDRAYRQATDKAGAATSAERRAQWQAVAAEAQQAQRELAP